VDVEQEAARLHGLGRKSGAAQGSGAARATWQVASASARAGALTATAFTCSISKMLTCLHS